jgi:hypothetical protein
LVVDVDELRITQPGLEIRGGERHLKLSESRAPDLLGIHLWGRILLCGDELTGEGADVTAALNQGR